MSRNDGDKGSIDEDAEEVYENENDVAQVDDLEEDGQLDETQISILNALLEDDDNLAVNDQDVLAAVRQYEKECCSWRQAQPRVAREVRISSNLILDRCINKHEVDTEDEESLTSAILHVTHLTLEGCNLHSLDNLDCYLDVTHAYFQHNLIRKIGDAFEFHSKLKVLVLAHNEIVAVEGVAHLSNLQLLDVSHNRIQDLHPAALPVSLRHFNIAGNPLGVDEAELCTQLPVHLPHLMQLNEIRIDNVMRIKCGAPLNDNTEADNDVKYGLKSAQQMEPEDEPEEENFWTTQTRGTATTVCTEAKPNESIILKQSDSEVEVETDALLASAEASGEASGGDGSHAGRAIAQALQDLRVQRNADRGFYDRIAESSGQLDAEAEQWLLHRQQSRVGASFGKPATTRPSSASARSIASLSSSMGSVLLPESQRDIPALHAELVRLSEHKGSFGCEQLNEDFDEALFAMRGRKDAIIDRSRQRRLRLEEAYAQRKDCFRKGNWSGARPTDK